MLRPSLRMLFGRVGRSLLILTALGLLWAAWWFWPERPLRQVRIECAAKPREFATISPDGQLVLLSNSGSFGDTYDQWRSRVIRLADGKELLDSKTIGKDRVSFDRHCEYILLFSPEEKLRTYRIEYNRFEEADSPQYFAETNRDAGFGWSAREELNYRFHRPPNWLIGLIPDRFIYTFGNTIHCDDDKFPDKVIPCASWCGFCWNDRGWSENLENNTIVLREWNLRPVTIPSWLWMFTGACILLAILNFAQSLQRRSAVSNI